MTFNEFLPLLFMGVMGLSLLIYVVLDGYDLGVGLLLPHATDDEKDTMINSIGPFWDANETWLVLGVGVLLVAFPKAHGVVLTALYLPVTFMLLGLVLRGVAFDFRVKVDVAYKPLWNRIFSSVHWLHPFRKAGCWVVTSRVFLTIGRNWSSTWVSPSPCLLLTPCWPAVG